MRNLAIVLCIALLAVAPLGTQSRSIQESLEAAKEKVQQIIDDAIAKAEEVIAAAKQQAVELGQKLKDKVDEFQKEVDKRAQEILDKVDEKLDEILGELDDPDASECRILANTVRDTVVATIANETKCITSKLDSGKMYIGNIYRLSAEVRTDLKGLRQEARECSHQTEGVKAAVEAIICLNKVGARAVWVSVKRVPDITANAVGLGFLVQTLPITLPKCAIENGVNSILENVGDLFHGVRDCVKEAVKGDKGKPEVPEVPEQTEAPEVPEVPELTEAPEVPEVPELTEAPEVPEVPELTEAPEVPEVPEQTEAPEVPEFPEQTEVPEVPEVPEETNKPEFPEFPDNSE